jgi:hypothetical protein
VKENEQADCQLLAGRRCDFLGHLRENILEPMGEGLRKRKVNPQMPKQRRGGEGTH